MIHKPPHRCLPSALGVATVLAAGLSLTACAAGTTKADEPPVEVTTLETAAPPTTVAPASSSEAPTTALPATVPTTLPPTTPPPPPVTYQVVGVADGDTIDIAASDGAIFTVRLIGIDAPEMDECEGSDAQAEMAFLTMNKMVALTMGGDGEDTDQYGRYLRYVDIDGNDVGLQMIMDGQAIARYDSRDGYGAHDREMQYIDADAASPDFECAPPPPPPTLPPPPPPPAPPAPRSNDCDPNYTPCVPIDSDVDCAGGSGNGPSYVNGPVRVIGEDVYGLDGNDNDGVGCE